MGMWFEYTVEECFNEALRGVCDTLVNHCEKDVRVEMPLGPNHPAWFMAANGTGEIPGGYAVKAKGASGVSNFRFCSDAGGAVIYVKNYPQAKLIFIDFIRIIQAYRKTKGLEPLNDDFLYSAEERKPAVTVGNYTAMTDERFDGFRDTLHSKFSGLSANMNAGKYNITVYAKNDAPALPPGTRHPLERKLLLDFKRDYAFDDAVCLAIKTDREYYTYFSVKGIGLFYNNENSSREFLEREHREIALLLTLLPNQSVIDKLDKAESGVTKFDLEYRRMSAGEYRLHINGKETKMRISAMYPVSTSSAGKPVKASGQPMLWIGEGATDGRREGRYYQSLDAAFQGESALVNRAITKGGIESLFGG
jgi:hypothetical protein